MGNELRKSGKNVRKKTILTMVLLLATVMLIPLSGCKNKKVIPVFTYEKNEDDTITIKADQNMSLLYRPCLMVKRF